MQQGSARHGKPQDRRTVVRFNLVYSAFLLGAAVLAAHLFFLGLDPDTRQYYASQVDQRWHSFERPQGRRGSLFYRDGTLLAGSHKVARIVVEPGLIKNLSNTCAELGSLIGRDPTELERRINAYPGRALDLVSGVPLPTAMKIDRAGLAGVFTRYYFERIYPHGEFCAASSVGYAGRQPQLRIGLEKYYDAELTGRDGKVVFRKDANRQRLPGSITEMQAREDGRDIITTLHPGIQTICEDELRKACKANRSEWGCVLVLDPRNGEILAAATNPSFDPNEYVKGNIGIERNVLVHATVEPGSIAKPLLVSYALEQGWLAPDDRFITNRLLTVDGYTINEAELSHVLPDAGGATLRRIITQSSNIGMGRVALSLGQEKVRAAYSAMGLFSPTGVELPGERRGRTPPEDKWPRISLATTGFGQGITATPLQMAAGFCVIANGGYKVQPHFALETGVAPDEPADEALPSSTMPEGEVLVSGVEGLPLALLPLGQLGAAADKGREGSAGGGAERTRVLSAETAALMNEWLCEAVSKGTGKKAQLELMRAAGKTGTGEIAGRSGYAKGAYTASFIGYFPAEAPRYLVLCMFSRPRGAYYGGQVAAPVFKKVGDRISYLDQLDQARSKDAEVTDASRRAD